MYPQPGNSAFGSPPSFSNPQFEAPIATALPAHRCLAHRRLPIVACPSSLPIVAWGPVSPQRITAIPSAELAGESPRRRMHYRPAEPRYADDSRQRFKERGICKTRQLPRPFIAVDWTTDGPR